MWDWEEYSEEEEQLHEDIPHIDLNKTQKLVNNPDVVDNRVTTVGNNDLQREERKSEESVDNGIRDMTFGHAFEALAKEENKQHKLKFEREKARR